MKFLVDMGISPKTVASLRALGHDAVHLLDLGQHRLRDEAILSRARVESRVLLTHDLDFGDLLAASSESLPSVIIFRLRDMRPEAVLRSLVTVFERFSDTLEKGAIITVSEGRARVRLLPLAANQEV